jgi:hypothetical protein
MGARLEPARVNGQPGALAYEGEGCPSPSCHQTSWRATLIPISDIPQEGTVTVDL